MCIEASLHEIQGGDSAAGTQALPVGNIIKAKVCRKDNPKVSQICICWRKSEKLQHIKKDLIQGNSRNIGKSSYIFYISVKFPKRWGME